MIVCPWGIVCRPERLVKFLLWQCGGWKVYVGGPESMEKLEAGHEGATKIWQSLGYYMGYAIANYAGFYDILRCYRA